MSDEVIQTKNAHMVLNKLLLFVYHIYLCSSVKALGQLHAIFT